MIFAHIVIFFRKKYKFFCLFLGLGDDQHDLGSDYVVDTWLDQLWQVALQAFPLPPGIKPIRYENICSQNLPSNIFLEFNFYPKLLFFQKFKQILI